MSLISSIVDGDPGNGEELRKSLEDLDTQLDLNILEKKLFAHVVTYRM